MGFSQAKRERGAASCPLGRVRGEICGLMESGITCPTSQLAASSLTEQWARLVCATLKNCLFFQASPSRWIIHLSFPFLSVTLFPLGSLPSTSTRLCERKETKVSYFGHTVGALAKYFKIFLNVWNEVYVSSEVFTSPAVVKGEGAFKPDWEGLNPFWSLRSHVARVSSVIWPFWTSVSSSRSVLSETPYMNTWPRVRPWRVSIPFSYISIRIFSTVGSALTGWILMQIMSSKASGPEVTDWDILIIFTIIIHMQG